MSPSQKTKKSDTARTRQTPAIPQIPRTAREPQAGVVGAIVLTLVGAFLLAGVDDGGDPSEVRISRVPDAAPEGGDPLDIDVPAVAEHDEALAERLADEPDVLEPLARAAADFDVDTELVLALAWHESRWDPGTVSHANAVGVMQVMPGTADSVVADVDEIEGPVDLTDPADNAAIGTAYIGGLLDRYDGDRRRALQAYNQGYVTLEQQGPYPSAASFSERVVTTAEALAAATQG